MDKATTDIGLVQDIRGLDQLRKLSNQGDASQQQALEAAARQFEAIFNQMWVGSMRQANSAIAPDSPLNSRYSQFFQGMLDEQMTASMASPKSNSSLSRLIVKQLSPKSDTAGDTAPRELKMPDERLPVMRRFARWEGNNSQNSVTDAVGTDGAYTGNNARADSAVQAGVAAAERFVARMERMQRQGNGGSDSAAASNFSSPRSVRAATFAGSARGGKPDRFIACRLVGPGGTGDGMGSQHDEEQRRQQWQQPVRYQGWTALAGEYHASGQSGV